VRRARLVARVLPAGLAAVLASTLAACHKPPEAAPEPRPALTTVVHADGTDGAGDRAFVGTIEPRYSTELAFRVGGKIVRRSVSLGDHVKRGQEIAALDRRSLELAVAASAADLSGGTAQRDNADTTFGRQTALRAQNSVAQTSLDEARTSQAAALATVNQAQARLQKAQEDLGYGVLHAELDGVVTRIDFEVEQVVAANQVIAEVARPDVLDLVLDVPESAAETLQIGDAFTVRMQEPATGEPPGQGFAAKVRQLNPAADRTTRTRRVWLALDGAPPEVRLGATMYAVRAVTTQAPLRVPLTALLEAGDAGASSVWIVEGDALQSRLVTLGARSPDDAVVTAGLHDGERILTAGVHSVTAGQRIKLEGVAAR
jgi:RND family efflux transporter MFP subunit